MARVGQTVVPRGLVGIVCSGCLRTVVESGFDFDICLESMAQPGVSASDLAGGAVRLDCLILAIPSK